MARRSTSPSKIRDYRKLARAIVMRHFGRPANRIIYKASGLTNHVFAINHVEGQFVIRISPNREKIDSFRKELWATQKARDAGVPTHEVLHVGNEIAQKPYMISRFVSGSNATHHRKRLSIVHKMGSYAAMINSIRTSGFGMSFDWSNENPKHSWNHYLDEEWNVQEKLETLVRHKVISKTQQINLRKIVDRSRVAPSKPALNHGDLRLKNVLVDEEGEITAIVDWDDCLSATAPQWELSIALHDLTIDEKHAFIGGYGLTNDQIREMASLIKTFNIINYAGAVKDAAVKKRPKQLAEFRLRLQGLLDLYSLC
jgi:aminoglycoside phosphotransferase (APT) family kinase protein